MRMRRYMALLGCVLACAALVAPAPASGAPWPLLYEAKRFDQLSLPTFITGDGTGSRLYIVEKNGRILVTPPGSQSYSVFLDLTGAISTGGERGLLGLAFSPDFSTSHEFYVNYTDPGGATVVSRFSADPTDPDKALPASEEVVLTFPQPYTNHNGGWIGFGPDGYLYISSGDGGGGGDRAGNAQNLSNLLGTMLRIDVVGETTYAIPGDNPFVSTSGARPEIWSYGLRNPWRCSFDPGGNLWIGDVGQNAWEELDFQAASSSGGENYGWNPWEGNHPYPPGAPEPPRTGYTFPVWEYRTEVDGEAIVGGYVYDGAAQPGMQGTYYCGDYIFGSIWGVRRSGSTFTTRELLKTSLWYSSFGEGDDGTLFVCAYRDGEVYELRDAETYSDRLSDRDRYSTCVSIAREVFDPAGDRSWPGVDHVVLASGDDRAAADPLAAAGLSWAYESPILLTGGSFSPNTVSNAIAEMVDANGSVTVHVVGGTTSVPWSRLADIRAYVAADLGISEAEAAARVAFDRPGPNRDRYVLATTIARRMESVAAADAGKTMEDAVLVANGADNTKFFDALALSPIASSKGTPIVLVAYDRVPGATRAYLDSADPGQVIVGGGPATINNSVYRAVGADERWWGKDRYAAATAIGTNAVAKGWLANDTVGLTARLPDGLTGGAAVGRLGGVQLVTQTERLSTAPKSYLGTNKAAVSTCYVFGGPKSVTDACRIDIARALD